MTQLQRWRRVEHTSGKENIVGIDGKVVDDGVVTIKVLHEGALGALPLLYAPSACRGEGVLGRMESKRPHPLLVVCKYAHGLPSSQVPESDGGVERGRYDLGIGLLTPQI